MERVWWLTPRTTDYLEELAVAETPKKFIALYGARGFTTVLEGAHYRAQSSQTSAFYLQAYESR
jgi:hypothetical protein